jgi:hypothetical protein
LLIGSTRNLAKDCRPATGIEAFDINQNRIAMYDLIFIAVIALFFFAGGIYARWCEKL